MKKVAILRFPGTNCEFDTKYAFERFGASCEIVWHKEQKLPADTGLVVVPGGFSYGDYLRSGAIARFSPIMQDVIGFVKAGGFVFGICNGFQILLESGLLPGAMKRNENLHFISDFVSVNIVAKDELFLSECEDGERLTMPVAHAEGNYYAESSALQKMQVNGQIALRYCDEKALAKNINGSVIQIAGIFNEQKNVFALMPHPERAVEGLLCSEDGAKLIKGAIKALR